MKTNEIRSTKDPQLEFKRACRSACFEQRVNGYRGRTDHGAGVTWSTPVEVVEGDAEPRLEGLPYWKTGFSNGHGFSMILYTHSTLRIVVGRDWDWKPAVAL